MIRRLRDKGNHGFSLVETLAVVAIMVILLGISAVAASYYKDYLKITELDNAARDIYMAAENRAVLLDSSGQLSAVLGASTLADNGEDPAEAAGPICVSKDDAGDKGLLTSGAVDPALLDGDFYIYYDLASGAVTDVFYAEKPIDMGDSADAFYSNWAGAPRENRMRPGEIRPGVELPMLGYYGGEQAERDKEYTPLPAPKAIVEIENGEELRVKVTFSLKSSTLSSVGEWFNTAEQVVTLTYNGVTIPLLAQNSSDPSLTGSRRNYERTPGVSSVTYTWVLDALDTNGSTGRHFRQLFQAGEINTDGFGGDFTVSAKIVLSAEGRRSASASGSDTDNSLFAEHSGGTTARLENLRHLQNLDTGTSGAGGKEMAVQLQDIDCGQYLGEDYTFTPIFDGSKKLASFDAGWWIEGDETRRNEITNLHVTAAGDDGAGLFAETIPMEFTGVTLVDADVFGGDKPAGVLVGSAGGGSTFREVRIRNSKAVSANSSAGGVAGTVTGSATFEDCWVYWEPVNDETDLQSQLGSDQKDNPYKFNEIISGGTYAGGLVGTLSNTGVTTEIRRCLAATLVNGDTVGGLIGGVDHKVTVETSYADCYIKGKSKAAGLIGSPKKGGTGVDTTLTNVYAAGFIDLADMKLAAPIGGIVTLDGTVEGTNVYSAVSYLNRSTAEDEDGNLKPYTNFTGVVPYNEGLSKNCYYMESTLSTAGDSGHCLSYDEMSGSGFATKMGGAFTFKTPADTHAYNLREDHRLVGGYVFPGLRVLPHYGDWAAYFKEPSLVYYEEYADGSRGFSGGNARTLNVGELQNGTDRVYPTVRNDGYAVALRQEDLGDAPGFTVTYTYLTETTDKDGKNPQPALRTMDVAYAKSPSGGQIGLLEATWTRQEGGQDVTDKYYLAPLPDELVTTAYTDPYFYQYLRFAAEGGITASGEYLYNPHFAETVRPYVPDKGGLLVGDGMSPAEAQTAVHQYITGNLVSGGHSINVSVRTPRHFYDLGRFENYYGNAVARLAFQQTLPLDGHQNVYTGHSDVLKDRDARQFQLQNPIGTYSSPFNGSYDGNGLTIRRIAFRAEDMGEDAERVCAGLFGYSIGALQDIVYSPNEDPDKDAGEDTENALTGRRIVEFRSSQKHTYLGALVGCNETAGRIVNCAVSGISVAGQATTSVSYIGGLCGLNIGTIENSAAECAYLHVEASNYARAYLGGLVGANNSQIARSYAVGRLSGKAAQDNADVLLGGFAGSSSGSISSSYCAMDLRTDGEKALAYGFCASDHTLLIDDYYLNDGNFSYRGEAFLAKYGDKGGAKGVEYPELTAETVTKPASLQKAAGATQDNKSTVFPYPTGVTRERTVTQGETVTRVEEYCHYGSWPMALNLGDMGVYYWEELKTPGKGSSYGVSLLAVDPGKDGAAPKTVSKISTLSTAHDQGGEVVRFGYGIYNKAKTTTVTLGETTSPLMYFDGLTPVEFNDTQYQSLNKAKETATEGANVLNRQVDVELTKLMAYELNYEVDENGTAPYEFHSFHTYSQIAAPADGLAWSGLCPNATADKPNGTLTLHESGNQTVDVTFVVNPLFADALAVVKPETGAWNMDQGVPVATDWQKGETPGSQNNPYGVRSIDQLQFIDWNNTTRNVTTVVSCGDNSNINQFPYLASATAAGDYFWVQGYDLKGAEGKTYTPIAEYYDTTNTNNTHGAGNLYGWFGGSYNGGSYKIENVNIRGQVSSTVGLFGIVYNGQLQDVVLYSSGRNGTIGTDAGIDEKHATVSHWFTMGALAGLAATSDQTQNAIKNCAVAGYTIDADLHTAHGWGGSNIGGLVGTSQMNLEGCSAEVNIQVRGDKAGNKKRNTIDNVRVGGLAGSCQGTLQNCYAGGSISVDGELNIEPNNGIYIGGLVGGSYINSLRTLVGKNWEISIGSKTSRVENLTNNTLRNCYSYVKLPPLSAHKEIKALYLIGGTGEINRIESGDIRDHNGATTYDNCYFLTSESLANFDGSEEDYLDAIDKRGAKTDLDNVQHYKAGTEYALDGTYKKISELGVIKLVNQKDNSEYDFYQVSIRDWPYDDAYTIYYKNGDTVEDGLQLFRFEGKTAGAGSSGAWYYRFLGWLVNYQSGATTWYLSTNPPTSSSVTGLTYEELSGAQGISAKGGDDIYTMLNRKKGEDDLFFAPVTVEDDGVPVPGKYSYSTGVRPDLRDRDYPFPTILTQDGKHVHYGDWPLKGFRRQSLFDEKDEYQILGGSPIEIDVFANSGDESHQEYLVLTDGITQNDDGWSLSWETHTGDEQIAACKVAPVDTAGFPDSEQGKIYYLLTVTPIKDGTDVLDITYTAGGSTYSMAVTVHITAGAELRPNQLYMFPTDQVDLPVKAYDKAGSALTGTMELTNVNPGGHQNIGASIVKDEASPTLRFTTTGPEEKELGVSVNFAYTAPDAEKSMDYTSSIRVDVIEPWTVEVLAPGEEGNTTEDQYQCVITFPKSLNILNTAGKVENTLNFRIDKAPVVGETLYGTPSLVVEEPVDGDKVFRLTYPVSGKQGIPETKLGIELVMTSTNSAVIPEAQSHKLTLTVESTIPADAAELAAEDPLPADAAELAAEAPEPAVPEESPEPQI